MIPGRKRRGLPQWSPAFGAGKSTAGSCRSGPGIPGRNGAQLLELGKARAEASRITSSSPPQWSPAFGAGKRVIPAAAATSDHTAAMEPSFWSWEKDPESLNHDPQTSPQWSPAFGAGKSGPIELDGERLIDQAAMEPSFWSWEKRLARAPLPNAACSRNGAQLLELGKAGALAYRPGNTTRPQWSPAFGAGKSRTPHPPRRSPTTRRNGAQLLELGKELAIFSPTDYQCCTSLRAAEVLGQTSRVVAP